MDPAGSPFRAVTPLRTGRGSCPMRSAGPFWSAAPRSEPSLGGPPGGGRRSESSAGEVRNGGFGGGVSVVFFLISMLGGIARLVDCYMFPFLGAQTQGYGPKFLGIYGEFLLTQASQALASTLYTRFCLIWQNVADSGRFAPISVFWCFDQLAPRKNSPEPSWRLPGSKGPEGSLRR